MIDQINASDVIFLIGTPKLVSRLSESGHNNLKTEYNRIRRRQRGIGCRSCKVVPLLLDGDFGSAFPREAQRPWVR